MGALGSTTFRKGNAKEGGGDVALFKDAQPNVLDEAGE